MSLTLDVSRPTPSDEAAMVILRATAKVLRHLPASPDRGESDTALGDWYVNRVVVDRQPLLLLVSALSLLPLLTRARNVSTLPERLPELVGDRLRRLGVVSSLVQAETAAMAPVTVSRTADRSVLGILVDFAKAIPYYAGRLDEADLRLIESQLEETPCYAGRRDQDGIFPREKTRELLVARWRAR